MAAFYLSLSPPCSASMASVEAGLLSSMYLVRRLNYGLHCKIINVQLLLIFSIGVVGILWFFLWFYIGFSSPASHPRISEKERDYIETSIIAQGVKEEVGKFNYNS